MRAAKIESGIVTAIWVVPSLDAFPGESLVIAPAGVDVGWSYDGVSWSAPAPDMTTLRARKLRTMQEALAVAMTTPVSALGTTWDADQEARELLGQAITLAGAGLPLPTVWRDAQDNTVPVSALSDLLTIAGAISAQVQASYANYWSKKAAIQSAATVAELDEIAW